MNFNSPLQTIRFLLLKKKRKPRDLRRNSNQLSNEVFIIYNEIEHQTDAYRSVLKPERRTGIWLAAPLNDYVTKQSINVQLCDKTSKKKRYKPFRFRWDSIQTFPRETRWRTNQERHFLSGEF